MHVDLSPYISKDLIFTNLKSSTKNEVLSEITKKLCTVKSKLSAEEIYIDILKREELSTTGIGHGLAIPHCRVRTIDEIFITIGTCPSGIEYNAVDGHPVQLIFLVIGPKKNPEQFLYVFAELAKRMSLPEIHDQIMHTSSADEIYNHLISNPQQITH